MAINDFRELVAQLVEVPPGDRDADAPAWDDVALLCARTLNRWGGRLGRAALLAQLRSDLGDGCVRGGGAVPMGELLSIDVRIEATEVVPGAEPPLILATVHRVDGAGTRAGPTVEMALPERLCRLAGAPGMSALVEPGRVLRVRQPTAPVDAALVLQPGAPPLPDLLPSEVTLPLLNGYVDEDDMLAACAVSHSLAEVDVGAFNSGAQFTLLCRVGAVELSPALAEGAARRLERWRPKQGEGRGGGHKTPKPPPEVPLSEAHWARLLLTEGPDAPRSCVELLLLGSQAQLALCVDAPRCAAAGHTDAPIAEPHFLNAQAGNADCDPGHARARESEGTTPGSLLLIHQPYVQSGLAHSGERAVLRYGEATVVALVACAPPACAPSACAASAAKMGAPGARAGGAGGDVCELEGGRRGAEGAGQVVLLGSCVPPPGLSPPPGLFVPPAADGSHPASASVGWPAVTTAGGRVRVTLRLARAGGPHGCAPPEAEEADACCVQVCAPAHACAQLLLPPPLLGAAAGAAAGGARVSWCALARARAPLGRVVQGSMAGGAFSAQEISALGLACMCSECAAEAACAVGAGGGCDITGAHHAAAAAGGPQPQGAGPAGVRDGVGYAGRFVGVDELYLLGKVQ